MYYRLQSRTANCPLFRKATKLHLNHTKDWPLAPLNLLSAILDLSQLVEIKLKSNFFRDYKMALVREMATFIQRADNVSSLIITNSSYIHKSTLTAENICSMVPRHVKYLDVSVRHFQDMKMILERCRHLSSVQFHIRSSKFSPKIVQWLAENTIYSRYRESERKLVIWLGGIKTEPSEGNVDNKRIKLADIHHDS